MSIALGSSGQTMMDFLGLLSVIHFPDDADLDKDSYETKQKETDILVRTFNPDKYNADQIPKPVGPGKMGLEIKPFLHLFHIEPVDEDDETVDIHGDLTLKWVDPRAVWDPKKYGGVQKMSRLYSEFTFKPWIPQVYFSVGRSMDRKISDAFKERNAQLTMLYDGTMTMTIKLSLFLTCDFNYLAFPYDKQRCTFVMYMPYNMREVALTIPAGAVPIVARQLDADTSSTLIGDFVLKDIHGFTFFISANDLPDLYAAMPALGTPTGGQSAITKINADNPDLSHMLYFELEFERRHQRFFYTGNLTLVCMALAAQIVSYLRCPHCFLLLGLIAAGLLTQFLALSYKLPSDCDGTPLLVSMFHLAMFNIVLLVVGLAFQFHRFRDASPDLKIQAPQTGGLLKSAQIQISPTTYKCLLQSVTWFITLFIFYAAMCKKHWEPQIPS